MLFLFLKLLLFESNTELSTCAAGVGCRSLIVGLDSPVRSGMVVVRLAGRLLGDCDVRMPECDTGSTVTFMRASPVSMRKDLEGEARGFGGTEECAIGATLRRVKVCADKGEDARCNGSGEDEPDREDIGGVMWSRLSSRSFTFEWSQLFCCFLLRISDACRSH